MLDPEGLVKKLQFKAPQTVCIVGLPKELGAFKSFLERDNTILPAADQSTTFLLAFCTTLQEVESISKLISTTLSEDALVWVSYPKGSSKNYTCEFNRDTGWASLHAAGWLPVRQVAINEDWSALRFRKKELIPRLRRKEEPSSPSPSLNGLEDK